MAKHFENTFSYKLIYVFEIKDGFHKNMLKIGDTNIHYDIDVQKEKANSSSLNKIAHDRIKQYTNTAGISYNLLYVDIAVDINGDGFRDYKVHNILLNSGYDKEYFEGNSSREWFNIDLETAILAIEAAKNLKDNLSGEIRNKEIKIIFRPEQEEAINSTVEYFKNNKGKSMLWNAKMRFGKTLSALEVIRRLNFKRSIIITHRPVVNDGWYEDFEKIFKTGDYLYGSKDSGYLIDKLVESNKKYIYFASIQDLRGSNLVGGKFDKNSLIFDIAWDLVIIDEAHEGTTTELGIDVLKSVQKKKSCKLDLSGTPFNIISNYEYVYTWDYIMEQRSKALWSIEHFGDSNPYDELPAMKIYTYNIGELLYNTDFLDITDKAFNFKEFFRVSEEGIFYYENDIVSFLNLITQDSDESYYPYSNKKYRDLFKHTLWMLPGVREAKALSKLLKKHYVFGNFTIVNVAGDGDEEEPSLSALDKVKRAIKKAGNDGYTITLSCGKLTTGVTIPEWTGVLMLSGNSNTSASSYMQTIFRVQSPCKMNGKQKEYCYVFDFAPDRTIKIIVDTINLSERKNKKDSANRAKIGEFLNYCPVISVEGTKMVEFNTNNLMQKLKYVFAERIVKSGFYDTSLYNEKLYNLTENEIGKFVDLKSVIGTSGNKISVNMIDINNQGLDDENYDIEYDKKNRKEDSEEDKEIKLRRKQRENAINVLRSISIRLPLLIYGLDKSFKNDVYLKDFIELVDDNSWNEFMPKGVTKDIFKSFIKYYDEDIFIVASNKIRNIVNESDNQSPLERIKKITELFSYFKDPDRETILTPWSVVNRHISDMLGGYCFFDFNNDEKELDKPEYVSYGSGITKNVFKNKDVKFLEINSKTGLYPLYITYTLYENLKEELNLQKDSFTLWKSIIENNLFILCKTKMAKKITQRTLYGYKDGKMNCHIVENIHNDVRNEPEKLKKRISLSSFWGNKKGSKMNYDCIVGNPPYQENLSMNNRNASLSKQLFPSYIELFTSLPSKYVSLITPSRWFTGDAQDKSFLKLREYVKNNNHFRKITHYYDNKVLFKNVEIKGGINYFLWENDFNGKVEFSNYVDNKIETEHRDLFIDGIDVIIDNLDISPIINKIKSVDFESLDTIITGRDAFNISGADSHVNEISKKDYEPGLVELRCKKDDIRWINPEAVTKNIDIFKNYKVFISKSAGDPLKDKKVIGKPYIGEKNTACTDSLIPIGSFETLEEAINLEKYLKTKFLRFMVSILKSSQNVYQNVYKFVPLQDFTNKSDVNWDSTIDEIDEQLFKKYNLSEKEIDLIDKKVNRIK